ncbi:MAG: hypothetical protein C0609_02865 [Deltaproteobacteria bacterium]|nr:MAG: hypothetical protein C0609_02865 [Deltaproteobacteria bacterium]
MNKTEENNYQKLTDGELLELLHTSGDALPMEVVEEVLDRSDRMLPLLTLIVIDKSNWTRPMPEWWAAVHATYLLGAMESIDALPALMSALRWADAFDNEWVTEDLPSIFGKLGVGAYPYLMAAAHDISAGWSARATALMSMASICATEIKLRAGFLDFAAGVLDNLSESINLRQAAANILLDFRSTAHRDLLIKFGREEALRREEISSYEGAFYDWEVDDFLAADSRDLDFYQRDWMSFYEVDERQRRHDYWAEERQEGRDDGAAAASYPFDYDGGYCHCGSGVSYEECCKKKIH